MINHDETLLRRRRIDPQAPWPILHQALRIALYDEYAARAFYARVIEAFGPRPPFANIVAAEQKHIDALGELCARYGVPRPIDPFPAETAIEASWRGNLERAIAGEIANGTLYGHLLGFVGEPDVRQVFFNLQTASTDEHLAAFGQALERALALEHWHAQQGIPAHQAYVRHGPLSNALEQGLAMLARQHSAFGLIGPLARAAHPAMLLGMVVGGVAVHYLRQAPSTLPAESTS